MTDTQIPSTEIDKKQQVPAELPSIRKTLLKPRNLAIILIVSVLLNLLLFFSLILASQKETPAVNVLSPTSTPSVTSRPTIGPTRTLSQNQETLLKCFQNCSTEELVQRVEEEALRINYFKSVSNIELINRRNCFHDYLEASGLAEYHAYSNYPCASGYKSNPPTNNIHIEDNLYTLNNSGNWNVESKSRIPNSKLHTIVSELKSQPNRTSSTYSEDTESRTITGKGQVINDVNLLVEKTVQIKVNQHLEVTTFEILVDGVSIERGNFFALGEQNTIEIPSSMRN